MKSLRVTTACAVLGALIFGLITPVAFAYEAAPTANTLAPTYVTENSARFNARVAGNDIADTRLWFEWGLARDAAHPFTTYKRTIGGFAGEITETVNGLAPDTEYFVRAVIESSRGKDTGMTTYFHTKTLAADTESAVVVTTLPASFVDKASATLRGYASPHGGTGGQVWFAWGKTTALERETPHVGVGYASAEYKYSLTGLEPGTVYYYRAVGSSGIGRSEGELRWFLTPGIPPQAGAGQAPPQAGEGQAPPQAGEGQAPSAGDVLGVSTPLQSRVEQVSMTGAVTTGRVEVSGTNARVYVSYDVTGRAGRLFVEWGKTEALGSVTDMIGAFGSGEAYTSLAASLDPCTTYHYRGVLSDGADRVVGATRTLTTGTTVFGGVCGAPPRSAEGQAAGPAEPTGTTGAAVPGWGIPKWQPPPIFGIPFPGTKSQETGAASGTVAGASVGIPPQAGEGQAPPQSGEGQAGRGTISGSARVDSTQRAGISGALGRFFSGITGKKPLTVGIATEGDGGPHTPVEYKVSYAYTGAQPLKNAVLKVIFPKDVVYIGDDTANEFLLEDNAGGPERTYLLPLGTLQPGASRTITMLGMTTADAKGTPEARARVEFTDASGGTNAVAAASGEESAQLAAAGSVARKGGLFGGNGDEEWWSILPHTFFGWVIYILIAIVAVVGTRSGRAYYAKRKKELKELEAEEKKEAQVRPAHVLHEDQIDDERDPNTGMTPELFAALPR